jgi:serine/threonine protein kinase
MIIGIAGGAGAVLVIVVGGVIVCAIIAHKRNGARERLFLRPEIEMSSVAVVPSSAAVTKTKSSDNSVDKKFDISDLSHWHQVVGEGSFGKVWKCTYTPQDGPVAFVAVKCLDKISDDIDLTSSQREIHISTSCNSPYILPSFGSQEFKRKCDAYPKVWIIMPFMDGGPLDGWLKENKEEGKKTNGQLILRMALEIIRGIHYLHEVMNVIHRDLKPSNILLTSKEDPHAKISDFGTSRSVESDGTLTKEPVGTHDYLAPELLKPDLEEPKQPADKRSDIYALALILWALLTGDRPYDDFYEKQKRQGADYWATKAAFCSYIQTAEGRPKISSSLASRFGFMTEIIKNAWDTDPTRRPTAEKMKNDLETAPQMQEVVQAEDLYVQSLSQTS